MKIDPWYIFLAKIWGMVILAVIVGSLAAYLFIVVGVGDDGPDGYYTEHYHCGTIIGMNESRLLFYVETNTTVSSVPVSPSDFNRWDVGDSYEWWTYRYHRYTRITNLTMTHSW